MIRKATEFYDPFYSLAQGEKDVPKLLFGLTVWGERPKISRLREESMQNRILVLITTTLLLAASSAYAEKSVEDHIKTLSSGSESEKIESALYLGDKKEKSAVPELINLLNRSNDPKVAVPAEIALGQIAEPGDATIALKNKIISSDNGDIVYTALAALLNIVIKSETVEDATKEAVEYADKNRRSDEFVADFLNVLNKKLGR